MKKLIVFLICILTAFNFSLSASAESSSEEDLSVEYTTELPIISDLPNTKPQWKYFNNISITFYVYAGKANVSYFYAAKNSNVTVKVKVEKKTWGFIWVDIGEDTVSVNKKTYSGSFVVPVDDSGEYRATVEFRSSDEKAEKTMTYKYDEYILWGDVTLDGALKASDARLILRYSAKLEKFSSKQKMLGDINNDGYITASDARLALKMSAMLA